MSVIRATITPKSITLIKTYRYAIVSAINGTLISSIIPVIIAFASRSVIRAIIIAEYITFVRTYCNVIVSAIMKNAP